MELLSAVRTKSVTRFGARQYSVTDGLFCREPVAATGVWNRQLDSDQVKQKLYSQYK